MTLIGDNNMIRTQISLAENEYREAKAEAARQGISLAAFLRRALTGALVERRSSTRPWMRHAGILASGDPRASLSVDDVVYGRGRP
jgi:hypothetical protein